MVSLQGHLAVKPVLYAVDAVRIDGANVVHRAQQRFDPARQRHLAVGLERMMC